jgi:WhiB family redox-sensing transcriptional regulator
MELILNTKGVNIAFDHPTPREATSWRCASYEDPDMFDPADDDVLADARAFCGGCDSRAACLDLGVRREEWGVWGGVLLQSGRPMEKVKQRGRPRNSAA